MDRIYANSEPSIVAAAGDDPHYGLPGVGTIPRHLYSEVLLNGNTTLQFAVPGNTLLQYSVWMTRGWTYQEAFLARRLAMFTDGPLFLQCRKGVKSELFPTADSNPSFELSAGDFTPSLSNIQKVINLYSQ